MKRTRPSPAAGLRHWAAAFGKPPPEKGKAAAPGRVQAAYKDTSHKHLITPRRAGQQGRIEVDALLLVHLVLALVVGLLWEMTS